MDDNHCILIWGQGKYRHSAPFSPATNMPRFRLAPASYSYRAFIAVHEAKEAQQYHHEPAIQIPGLHPCMDKEYIANKNLFFGTQKHNKKMSVFEGAHPDDKMSLTSNLTSGSNTKREYKHVERHGPLTFDPSHLIYENDQLTLLLPMSNPS